MESRGFSEIGGLLWFCGVFMLEKSRRPAESPGLLGADDGVSTWHFHKHMVVLFHWEVQTRSSAEGK